jgi:hypothetical protein
MLAVRSRTSSFAVGVKARSVREIGRELGAGMDFPSVEKKITAMIIPQKILRLSYIGVT